MEFGRKYFSSYCKTVLITMMMFKWDIFCTETLDMCLSAPCQNNGTCVNDLFDYNCVCPTEPLKYSGRNCKELYDPCSQQPCASYRNCTSTLGTEEYHCNCPTGFTGTNCTININECDRNPCIENKTECGDDCQSNITNCAAEPCLNNGSCIDRPEGYLCECTPGFSGERCEANINECQPSPCRNGAICKDGVNEYHCFCVPGFQGYNCEIDINECASWPCKNNGSCINEKDHYVCTCLLGFTGVNCEVEIDECESGPCQNGATCSDHVGLYTCICPEGFEGLDCQMDIDECASQPCHNGAACLDLVNGYVCNCSDTGFVGENCEIDIPECDSNPCFNNASCVEGVKNYSCLCWSGFEGHHCELDIDECEEQPCQNGALCYERSKQIYYGELAEFEQEFSYRTAAGYLCHCQPGFTGKNCSVNIDECASMPCQNRGSCEDLINGYQCLCEPGFTGVGCETNIDECESSPCANGGRCEDGIDDYTCLCPAAGQDATPWGGKNCDTQLVGCQENDCQNGATCHPTYQSGTHSYSCQCPPGFYDERCNTSTTFSFTSTGYILIEVPLRNRTKRGVGTTRASISLRFRTTLPDRIIFYRGDYSDYMYLEIVEGLLHARAVLEGSRIYASLPGKVNDGQWQEISVTLKGGLVLTHTNCERGDCTKTQDGSELVRNIPESFKMISVGGVKSEFLLNNTESRTNFIGCIEDLRIDSQPVLPQRISETMAEGLQLGCSKPEWCEPNPCSDQGSCVDLWTGSRCHCYRPFHGPNCSNEYTPATFSQEDSTSSTSFNISSSHGSNFTVSFFLRTLKQEGLIFQLRNDTGPYFTLYLKMGRINVQILSGPPAVAPMYCANGEKQLLTVQSNDGNVTVGQYHLDYKLTRLPSISVKAGDVAHVGGLSVEEDASAWGGYFKGCLQDLRLDNSLLEFFPLENGNSSATEDMYGFRETVNVMQGCHSDDTCRSGPCENGGSCQVTWNDFVCSCLANFTGRTCERRVWCSSSPCPHLSQCVDVPGGYECRANATFQENNTIEFAANKSLNLPVTSISLDVRTRDGNAVLLRATNRVELFCIGLHNSTLLVKLRTENSVEIVTIQSDFPITDGLWHKIMVSMTEPKQGSSRWVITVDGNQNGTSLGVAGNLNFLNESTVMLAENYTGCLGTVRVGGVYLPFTEDHTVPQREQFIKRSGQEIQIGCRGNPVCTPNPCYHEGKCEDLFNFFECSCPHGWGGLYCQSNIDDCQSSPCLHGNCTDLLAGYKCDCYPGYTGGNCETNLDDCAENLCQNGGMCSDGIDTFSCACPPQFAGPLCHCETDINECTPNPCLNGGTCQDLVNGYECSCGASYAGQRCEADKLEQTDTIPVVAIAVPVVCGCFLLLIIGLIFMVLTARKRRQSEGTYSPSQQEVAGARLEMGSVFKVPPEERLI
ncbi:protein crumbs homolog 2-like isoform X2 [Polyodon spathula]|uniref:protein crumbs homolog 2-like isoform X2 n=1 Tax=Polyodon spathula TaxID=7913 RepID=UPI001B7DDE9B|nr:protein crumbs homolog 2-like isoform X2 [Polyodon spathula]